MLPILHRRRTAGLAALPLVLAASLALAGCAEGDRPEPAAGAAVTGAGGATPTDAADGDGTAASTPDSTSDAGAEPTTKAPGATQGAGNKARETPPDLQQGGPKTVVMIVRGKTVDPKPGTVKVKKGEPVLLVVITDKDGEVHVHGVDIEKETKAGKPTQIPLTFDETGSFEVELHEPELLLTKIVVS